jgi:hypothetical protein
LDTLDDEIKKKLQLIDQPDFETGMKKELLFDTNIIDRIK